MDREKVITVIQTAVVHGWKDGNTVEAHVRSEVLNGMLARVVAGYDKTQIVEWVNRKRLKVGYEMRKIVDQAYKDVENDL